MKQIRAIFFTHWHQISVGVYVIKACGRLKDLILLSNAHALRQALSYFLRFCVYVWTDATENDSNMLRADAKFFKSGDKNLRFQNYPDKCGRSLSGT